MAIKSSPFSGWDLSGKDADIFLNQIENSKPNRLATASLKEGRQLMAEYDKNGFISFDLPLKK